MTVIKVFVGHSLRSVFAAAVLLTAVLTPHHVAAQGNPAPFSFKFNSGQSIQPIFEGWAQNPDGTFSMYFGYFNRNYAETPVAPVGPDKKFEPGVPDRRQPTFFDTRIHRKEFSVSVPGAWGKKELVWSLTVGGVTEKAVAWLQPEWEIDPVYAGKARNAESLKNKPPSMILEVPSAVTLPNTLT